MITAGLPKLFIDFLFPPTQPGIILAPSPERNGGGRCEPTRGGVEEEMDPAPGDPLGAESLEATGHIGLPAVSLYIASAERRYM